MLAPAAPADTRCPRCLRLPPSARPCTDPGGVALSRMEEMCKPYAKPFKRQGDPYGLRSNVLSTQQSEAAAAVAGEGEAYLKIT